MHEKHTLYMTRYTLMSPFGSLGACQATFKAVDCTGCSANERTSDGATKYTKSKMLLSNTVFQVTKTLIVI
jgi:hypothetical protein